MRVFADLHHGDLYYSLQLLFEKRLGFELYRPIGLEWYTEGYWNVFDHPATAQQYLALDQATHSTDPGLDGKPFPENELMNLSYTYEDGIYYVKDPTKDKLQRAITLSKFKEMKFDIIISSIPQHIHRFNKLISLYQPQAKHIFQVGNAWGHQAGVSNILASTAPFSVPHGINVCFYHQEFDLNTYSYSIPTSHTSISSFIHYMQEMELFNSYRSILSDWTYKLYGAGMPEDSICKSVDIAEAIHKMGWLWHVKPGGDGYGHVLFSSYACGRPAIIKTNYYRGKLGSELLEDQKTCLDVSIRSVHENSVLLKKLAEPENHIQMCLNAYKRFKEVVDFNYEEQRIRKFIEDLK